MGVTSYEISSISFSTLAYPHTTDRIEIDPI